MSTRDVGNDLNIQNLIDYELQVKDINEMANITALKTLINILCPLTASATLKQMRDDFIDQYNQAIRVRFKKIDTDGDEKINERESGPVYNTVFVRR